MESTHKLSVEANIAENRLYITIAGKLTKENLDKLYTDMRFCVADLKPGFDVVNNLTGCTLAALSGIPTFKKITHYLITNKVGIVVRVIDEKQIIFRQIFNIASRLQGYTAIYVSSLEEAEDVLKDAQERDGLRFYLHSQQVEYIIGEVKRYGYILDISTSGCAIKQAEHLPAIGELVHFSTTFNKQGNLLEVFEINAKVIKAKDEMFTVKFVELDIGLKEKFWERLVHESKSERTD